MTPKQTVQHPAHKAGYFYAMTRLQALERIAAAAQMVRDLEKILVTATDTRTAMSRLQSARESLDEALADLAQLGRDSVE